MPSIQFLIAAAYSSDKLTVVGVNYSSSADWLRNYRSQRGITYPFVFDQKGELFSRYQVGSTWGNLPPTYVIVDTAGIVRYRSDQKFNRFQEMKSVIDGIISK